MELKEYKDLQNFSENKLQLNEEILAWSNGYIGEIRGRGRDAKCNGVLVVTNFRSVFYKKNFISEVFKEIAHISVNSVSSKKNVVHTTLTIHTSGDDFVFKALVYREAQDVQNKIESLRVAQVSPVEPAGDKKKELLKQVA